MPTCDICKRRQAFYRREYSGQNLCHMCLRRTLEKAMKKAIAESKKLSPGHTLLIPITLTLPYYSQILARILPHVEKKYASKVVIAVPRAYSWKPRDPSPNATIVEADIAPPAGYEDPIDCIRYDRAWSLRLAQRLGADAVVLPLTRTHVTLIGMEAILRGRPEALSETLLALDTRPPTINALYNIEAEAVAALGFALGIEPLAPRCTPTWLAKTVARRVLPGRPELAFSSGRVLPRLAALATRSVTRCKVCGGYSEGDVCRSCARTGALRLLAEDPGD